MSFDGVCHYEVNLKQTDVLPSSEVYCRAVPAVYLYS